MSAMTLFILFVSIIAILFLFINLVFAPHNPENWAEQGNQLIGKNYQIPGNP